MIKKLIAIICLLSVGIGSLPVLAQQKKKKTVSAVQRPFRLENANIWKVSGNGLKAPSYVMGTIHMICAEKYNWSAKLEQAYKQTQQVCVELDISDPVVQMEIMTGMKADNGKGLSSYFSAEEYQNLDILVKEKMGVPVAALEQLSPGILVSLFALQSFSCPTTESYDMNIIGMAKKDGKTVRNLETAAQQVEVLKKMSEGEELEKMKLYLNDNSKDSISHFMSGELNNMMQYYADENLTGLEAFILNTEHLSEAVRPVLADDRNLAWIPRMETLMKEKSTFFAVGIAHLVGEQGVLQLLHRLGYKVEPVF